jgi:signal transduction histidine kinase
VEGALSQLAQHADEQELLAEALAELERARRELREFARGVHPHLLTDAGLSAALADLARGAGVPVEVRTSDGRASAAVEAAAYFVCSEALANAAKHAGASTVAIDVDRRDSKLIVAIRDDGCGGARFDGGSGLGGLADRVEAVGGRFSIDSPRGRGTLVVAELPLA